MFRSPLPPRPTFQTLRKTQHAIFPWETGKLKQHRRFVLVKQSIAMYIRHNLTDSLGTTSNTWQNCRFMQ
eukprot:3874265-Lingulodinium_polyedra.AAC.1